MRDRSPGAVSRYAVVVGAHQPMSVNGGLDEMTNEGDLVVCVCTAPGDDAEELAEVTRRLRAELLDLDVQAVNPVTDADVPEGAKGLPAVAGWLAVHLGSEGLRTVLAKVADWASRNDRTVEVTLAGGTLKLGRATRDQQEKIIDAWLAQHAPGT